MKNFKILVVLLAVTSITSSYKVYAYAVYNIVNAKVPGNNGVWNTPDIYIPLEQMGAHHYVNNINVTRELDVILRKKSSYVSPYIVNYWALLKNNYTTVLSNSLSPENFFMQDGEFDLYIDSRWYYIGDTTIKTANWFLQ